ncbi:MAG: flagellar basal body P-ring protein FlgI [Burkholderiales bacterium]
MKLKTNARKTKWPLIARATGCLCLLIAAAPMHVFAERIKDIASIQGVRANQLIGYGLIVGLDGTGDQTTQTPFTTQSLQAMLAQLGVTLPAGVNLQLKNVAAVMVTAMLPAFAKPGQNLDVTVSSMGNSKSLRGGTLLLTPLRGVDGQVYGMAQGSVVIAGAGASAGGSKAQVNQLNSGRVPNGATVERVVASPLLLAETIDLELNQTDFGNARRVAEAVNANLGRGLASAMDGRLVRVRAPMDPHERVEFLSRLEDLAIEAGAAPARVIINARTGSVVMNQAVTLAPCAVAHGNLTVTISATPEVSQPNPLSAGQTVTTERADIQIKQESANLVMLQAGTKLSDVVKALNALGANPQDLLAILQAMKAAGALRAELEII